MSDLQHMKLFQKYYNDYIKDLEGLLMIPSVLSSYNPDNTEAPFGKYIRSALNYMLALGERDGFNTVNVDNYCGFIEYGEGEELILIMCHLDVVPATGKWTNPPFDPIIKEGMIYARGTSDDKGPLMSAYYALKMLRDANFYPNKRVRLFFGCDEETGSRGLKYYKVKYPECDYGFSPDANFPLIFAEKGISNIEFSGSYEDPNLLLFDAGTVTNAVPDKATAILGIDVKNQFINFAEQNDLKAEVDQNVYTLYGKSCHGSTPECGTNAALYFVYFLCNHLSNNFVNFVKNYLFLDFNGEKLGIDVYDEEMGHVSNNAAIFKAINNQFSIVCNLRYPKNFNFDEQMKKLSDLCKENAVQLKVQTNSRYHYVPKGSIIVRALLKSYKRWTKGQTVGYSEPISIGGGTYARDFENAVAFGALFPGEEECMHQVDEHANIENLILASFIYMDAIKNICDLGK